MIGRTHQGHDFLVPLPRLLAEMGEVELADAVLVPSYGVYSLAEKQMVGRAVGLSEEQIAGAVARESQLPCPFAVGPDLARCSMRRGHGGECAP